MQQQRPGGADSAVRTGMVVAAGLIGLGALAQSWRFAWVAAAFAALYAAGERAPGNLVVAVPGAALLAWRAWPAHQGWARWALLAVVLAAAASVADLERRWAATTATPLLGLLAAGGVYACVPETGHMRFVAWVFVVLGAAELLTGRRTGPGPALAAAALLGWAVLFGGTYRDGALVGGFASLGLLVVEPVARRLPGPRRPLLLPRSARETRHQSTQNAQRTAPRSRRGRRFVDLVDLGALLALQAGYALLVSRTAGLRDDAAPALALALPMVGGLAVVTRLLLGPVAPAGPARTMP